MIRILVIDLTGQSRSALESGLEGFGWTIVFESDASRAQSILADAIVLATDEANLGHSLKEALTVRQTRGIPVVLITDLDPSGWDRAFESGEALNVDALFDLPVDGPAVAARLKGILTARHEVRRTFVAPEMKDILARAIANEEAAEAFYRRAAQSMAHPLSREVLESLMRDEAEHKRLLQEFQSGVRALPETPPPHSAIVEAFGTPDFSPDMTPPDAFLLAANKEKLAVEMYENWAKLYPDGAERQLLLRMADIERMHKAKVESMFTNSAFPEVW